MPYDGQQLHIFSCFSCFTPLLLAWGLLVACIKTKSTLKGMGVVAPSSEIWVWGKCLFAMCRPSSGGGGWVQKVWVIES